MSSVLALASLACSSAPQRRDAPPAVTEDERLDHTLDALLDELPPPRAPLVEITIEGATAELALGLRSALRRAQAGEGTARIVVLGGSHVAGDLVTGPLRRILQRHFGDAGHGFVFPLPPYDRYWQSGVEVEEGEGWAMIEPSPKHWVPDHYGPLASALVPVEPAFAALTARAHASQVELFYLAQPGGGALTVAVDGTELLLPTDEETVRGASHHLGFVDGEHRLEIRSDGATPTRLFGLALERSVPGVIVDQMGMNGITPTMMLLAEAETSTTFLRARRPDVLVLWLGGNESGEWWPIEHHEEQLRALLSRLRAEVPGAACLVLGALDRRQLDDGEWEVPPTLAGLFDAQRRTAIDAGCAFFDSLAWQGGAGAVERLEAAALMRPDRVHLVTAAYEQYAASLTRSLVAEILSLR